VSEQTRALYATAGSTVVAVAALAIGGGHPIFGFRAFWLPFIGGLVWAIGALGGFRAAAKIGIARAAGIWSPMNIVVAFVWGSILFGELDHFGLAKIIVLVAGFIVLALGVVFVVRSEESELPSATGQSTAASAAATRERARSGLLWAGVAGILWGTYFVPAQWSQTPGHVADLPLTLGSLLGCLAVALLSGSRIKLPARTTAIQLGAGLVFGIGMVTTLDLVARVGTGVGYTIAQLGLVVNTSIGIWVFKVPRPGSRAAHIALSGIVLAMLGGCAIGALG
jgi:glucose uptake protein